ncbi:MAG: hypothetical protein PHR16_11910 [Methylovulum sp.]|nr:hypothetical protein [Methylovulum sp.]
MADYTRTWVRLLILQALNKALGYHKHQAELLKSLAANDGVTLSRDDLHIELSWLENADAVVLQIVDGVYIATLTMDGQEIAEGIKQVPGIDRPAPGC